MTWEEALADRDDISGYGAEALGLFGLALRFGIDDLVSVAADAVTDGQNDKKIDILYVDSTQRAAFLMQCCKKESKFEKSAPANKASDLHTAVAYAFATAEENLPEKVKPQIIFLRNAIRSNDIDTIYIWYVHNRTESDQISRELNQVELSAQAHLERNFPANQCAIFAQEVGRNTLKEWYDRSSSAIIVNDDINFSIDGSFERRGKNWTCLVTSISGKDLFAIYRKYSKDLFSLNVRDYLGIVKKDANVNNNIRRSAQETPDLFWSFNNGLTAIVNDYNTNGNHLNIKGIAIVNGAQTTGAIGNLEIEPSEQLFVPARFFKTLDQSLIDDIIRFNNSQNAIEASDFRSTDPIQKRLRNEFNRFGGIDYEGGRRGNVSDAIKRRPNLLPSYTVGQALAAFHGDPVLAYNEKSRIWSDNTPYNKIFNDETDAAHIIFCFSLLRAIEARKKILLDKQKQDANSITRQEAATIDYFRQKGSQFLLVYVVSQSMETILSRAIPNHFRLSFGEVPLTGAMAFWHDILDVFLSFPDKLAQPLKEGLKSNERAKAAADDIRQTLEAIKNFNEKIYSEFARKIVFR